MNKTLRLLSPLGVVLLAACPQRAHVWIEPGATRDHLVFRIGQSVNRPGGVAVGVFRIDPCESLDGSRAAWIASDNTGDDKTDRIEYGQLPINFVEERGAIPLSPGCYQASVSGSPGRLTFDILPSGAVHARPTPN